jgi:hypothetical protein
MAYQLQNALLKFSLGVLWLMKNMKVEGICLESCVNSRFKQLITLVKTLNSQEHEETPHPHLDALLFVRSKRTRKTSACDNKIVLVSSR